jgi:murein L,D-transpeptidase YcbB/YkuD
LLPSGSAAAHVRVPAGDLSKKVASPVYEDESVRTDIRRAITVLTSGGALENVLFRDRIRTATLEFYRQCGYRDAWKGLREVQDADLGALQDKIRTVLHEHGLRDVQSLGFNPEIRLPDGCVVSREDLCITLSLVDAGVRVRFGFRSPPHIWQHYPVADEALDHWFDKAVAGLFTLRHDRKSFFEGIAPQNAVYRSLVASYRDQIQGLEKARELNFKPVALPQGASSVKVGDVFPDAARLASLLASEGAHLRDSAGSESAEDRENRFTAELSAALKEFQRANLLNADGVLGSQSLAALNVGPEDKIKRLVINIQRARQLPDDLGERFVVANIPSAEVEAYDHGRLQEKMRIVFGQSVEGMRTPIFHDVMRYVVFRPYWRVPPGIVVEEIAPETAEDPMSFYRKGYEIVENYGDTSVLDPTWENLAAAVEGQLRIRQKPGSGNALGLVKFLFPNPHSVYMHDTPQKHLFARDRRDFSHGCIRLQHPEKMARYVLGSQGWDEDRIRSAMEAEERRSISIEQPIKVYIVYFTVWPDALENGRVLWKPDIYGRDEAAWLKIRQADGAAVDLNVGQRPR